ncbi:MAG: O-antigen polymerase [Flavobacteriaceae bacterium]|nr:O-antigen polymerase [Flavobacteriaceae bacterium]
MGIAPILQYHYNISFADEPVISDSIKLLTTIYVITAIVFYNTIYFFTYSKFSIRKLTKIFNDYIPDNSFYNFTLFSKTALIGLSILSFFMIFKVNNFNILSMLFRGGIFAEVIEIETSSLLLIDKFFRPLSLSLFIISFYYNRKSWFINSVLFILFVITAFPLGMARNAAAGFYLPLVLIFVPIFKRKHFFVSSLIFGLLVIFPFLDNFRRFNDFSELEFSFDFHIFTDLHFDAYSSFVRAINYETITYGNQLLGVLLFFVPRSIWPTKPIGSGALQAHQIGMTWDNISCTYFAEGYINFGLVGVFLFVLFIAYFTAIFDKAYWRLKENKSFINIIYILSIGMFLFILRGDLLSSYAYTFGLIFTSILTFKLFNLKFMKSK